MRFSFYRRILHRFAFVAMLLATAELCAAVEERVWSGAAPAVSVVAVDGGYTRVSAEGDGYLPDLAALGKPALPQKTILFDLPDSAEVVGVSAEVEWETLAEKIKVEPVGEPVRDGEEPLPLQPDAAVYNGTEAWPAEAVRQDPEGRRNGARLLPVTITPFRWHPVSGLLERASAITVKVSLKTPDLKLQTLNLKPQTLNLKLQTSNLKPQTLNLQPLLAAAPAEAGLYRTDPKTNAFEYLLISPPDFYDDWCWYVDQRKNTHTNLRFAVKNTAAIYAAHPFGGDNDCRNAAESIHAYLRGVAATSNGLEYVVLGGAWLDAQNLNNYTPYFATGEAMSLSNCVPGIYGFPREEWRQIPADLFYGCFDMNKNQKYPWDNNNDGKYIDKADCSSNDTYPDVCVSRITLNPYTGISGKVYNQHELITNYVAKLKRGEDKYFAGHYRYGMSCASTGSSKLRKTGNNMQYRELEFYDDMYNMFDPRHHDSLEDGEGSTRVRYYEQFSTWRPLRSVKGMMNYTWTKGLPTLSAAMDDYYAGDRDFGYVQAHGWAQGAAQFSAYRFATATGLTLFNGGSGPCETGYPDYHVGNNHILQYNVGDAAVTNPKGGALASVNNSRWSWAGGGGGFAAMSYYMLNEMLIGFNGERLDVGHAWLKGVRNYWPAGRWGNTAGWVLSEQFLYGDPLVRLPEVPNVWWTGGETGVWDRVTANWTNHVDTAETFDAARNVYFDVQTNLALDVAGEIAAMRLSIPVWQEDAVVAFAGTGTLKVVQSVDVAGTNTTLKFDVAGGVGHSGIQFLTGAGDIVFEGTNQFYVGGVKNAKSIALKGGGVTLDIDEFASRNFPIRIDGRETPSIPLPNELRSKNAGGLTSFGSLAITNSHVKLSTVDAFGNGSPMTHTLADSKLEIAANVYYQRSGFPEGLNATFLVDGDSSVTSSEGGLWTVKHTTTFVLNDAHLTLSADTVNAGGKIVITNAPSLDLLSPPTFSNTVTIASASALSGDVTVGAGVRLVLKELPLSSVTSLTVGEGATVELPDDESGYWQIVPVSSKFSCADNVKFVLASDPTNRLAGSSSKTGSFFKECALYRWTGNEGDWNTYFANRHPKILFGDIEDASVVTVRVAAAVSPEFAFFSNLKTKYVFESVAEDASVMFSSVYFCGPTEFNVSVGATEYVDISTSTSKFTSVTASYVHVVAGAGLALAGSHWTDFRLDEGAVLVAVPGEALDYNADTTITFPDNGEVLIDISALDLLSPPTFSFLITGHAWSLADLKEFRLVQTNAELRIDGDALGVTRGDNLNGPYELSFIGSTNWNNSAWTAASNAFPKAWGECSLDWTADGSIVTTNLATSAILTLDCDVHLQTLTIYAGTNNFRLESDNSDVHLLSPPTFSLATLDLTDCHGTTDIGVDLGDATILTESSTNGADVVRLRGNGSGMIDLSGVTLILDHPGDWSLTLGAQGVLQVVAPQAYERFRIAKVPDGFKDSALTVKVLDAQGREIDGFETSVADGGLWCVPPALEADVPPGTNDLTRLEWRDVLGNVVSNVDWNSSAGFKLIGTETSGVVIAKSGFASVWSRLSVSNEVTIYGNETLSPTVIPRGSGVLALAGAFTLKVDVNANQTLLSGAKLKLGEGTTLELRHQSKNYDARSQDWSGITGTGRIVFADGIGSWIALPSKIFADTLSVENGSDIVLTEGYGTANPLRLRNLSGEGRFRADWSSGNKIRPVRTVQTGVSAFSGCLHVNTSDGRTAKLVVSSDAAVASTNKALVIDGAAIENHALDIETNGCVILTGSWIGNITVEGLLVITNACATNGLNVTTKGNGAVQLVAPEELPTLTASPAYVEPEYPEDPDTPDEPAETDERVRILCASVDAGSWKWSTLDWRGTNGAAVATIDWSAVTNVTLTATNGVSRVLFDEEAFVGVVRLAGQQADDNKVVVEARKTCPFVLTTNSVGTVDFRIEPVPTSTCDLLYLQPPTTDYQLPTTNFTVTIHDRYGREIEVAGEVTFDAVKGRYYLYVQNVDKPWISNTFDTQYDDSLSSSLSFQNSGALTYKDHPENFVTSRSGRAITGYFGTMHSHNDCQNFSMDGVNAFSVNIVAKLPKGNGVILCLGGKHKGNGLAFARISENVAGVYVWENSGTPRVIVSSNVPFGSTQFHSYAIAHDGTTIKFYVDGVLVQAEQLSGKHPSMGYFQWFNTYGGGIGGDSSAAVDDCRIYNYCLTPASVRAIARQFEPWPEYPSAVVDAEDLAWSNLYWSAECDADDSLTLVAGGGGLKLDAPVALGDSLSITGGKVPIAFTDDGMLTVRRGIAVISSLELDASGLDGAAMAANAVYGAPYSRWLVRGTLTGKVTVRDELPEMPHGYSVESVVDAYGVRLVVTAPWFAKYGSLSFNFAGNTDKSVNSAATRVSDNANYKGIQHGAHPIVGSAWCDLEAKDGTTTKGGVQVTVAQVANAYGTGKAVGDQILYGYVDDSKSPLVVVSNIPYASYRIITYHATDTANTFFCPVWMGATAADAVRYFGPTVNSASGGYTASGVSDVCWGDSDCRSALAEGVNYVVSDVITGEVGKATAYIRIPKLSSGRACLAAFQIVEVRGVYESQAVDYRATVTNDTCWADGEGAGLVHDIGWLNDTNSILTLVAPTSGCPLVTFDTAVTASVLKVESKAGELLALDWNDTQPFAVDSIDLKAAKGVTVFPDDWFKSIPLVTASGTRIRLNQEVSSPLYTKQDLVVAYPRATFSKPTAYDWVLRTEYPTDVATLAFNDFTCLALDVSGGAATLGTAGCNQLIYGGVAATGTNSIISVNGGTFTCPVGGDGKTANTRGMILGNTSSATMNPRIVVNSGLCAFPNGVVTIWQKAGIIVNGGVFRTRGVYKGSSSAGFLTLNGGILELGGCGIAKYAADCAGALTTTLAGGTVHAVETSTIALPVSLTKASAVAATNDATLTFGAAVTGNGGLTIGAAGWNGKVVFSDAATRLGNVTIAPGTEVSLPFAALTGDLTIGEGATLDLLQTSSFPAVTNRLCTGKLTMPANVTVLLNGEPLPAACRLEDGALIVNAPSRNWVNPVTGESVAFTYRFTGKESGNWQTVANWEKFGICDWGTLTGSKVPMLPDNGIWDPTVIDGAFITNAANRLVTLDVAMEGWQPRLAVFNCATATVKKINKFQSENVTKFLWVDATSKLTFGDLGAASYNDVVNLYVAASNGIAFVTGPGASGATFQYYLKDNGSVEYRAAVKNCGHRIRRADFQLSASGIGKAIRSKRLVSLAGGDTVTFTSTDATVLIDDPAEELSVGKLMAAITVSNAVGCCMITQRTDGVWLDYVDRAPVTNYVHEYETTNGTRQIEIPESWLKKLMQGPDPILSPENPTPAKIAVALESSVAPNGLKPWQSYLLGLDPTNALDDIRCAIEIGADGQIDLHLPNVDPQRQPFAQRLRYVLQHKPALTNSWSDLRESESHPMSISTDGNPSGFYRYRIEFR